MEPIRFSMMARPAAVIALLLVLGNHSLLAQNQKDQSNFELNTVLMESTFKIEGPNSTGTSFIMGRPYVHPPADQPNLAANVLITAAHVLNEMQGDVATLYLRRKVGDTWVRVQQSVPIRANGQPLWKKHPDADIAVMYVALPQDNSRQMLSTDLLADDKMLAEYEIHPGDDLECLGYPLGQEANDAGFPILRSGRIASYPLLPTSTTKTFLFDFRVFRGNSGGPVYLVQSDRFYKGGIRGGQLIHMVLGLVSEERMMNQVIRGATDEFRQTQLGLGVVVHASLIKEAINLLPPPDEFVPINQAPAGKQPASSH